MRHEVFDGFVVICFGFPAIRFAHGGLLLSKNNLLRVITKKANSQGFAFFNAQTIKRIVEYRSHKAQWPCIPYVFEITISHALIKLWLSRNTRPIGFWRGFWCGGCWFHRRKALLLKVNVFCCVCSMLGICWINYSHVIKISWCFLDDKRIILN